MEENNSSMQNARAVFRACKGKLGDLAKVKIRFVFPKNPIA